jgi:hypothetical protein
MDLSGPSIDVKLKERKERCRFDTRKPTAVVDGGL